MGRANCRSQLRPCALVSKAGLHLIEQLDLVQEPPTDLRELFPGFVELAPRMRPTGSQSHRLGMLSGEGGVDSISVALKGPGKVCRQHLAQAFGGTARLPVKEHISSRLGVCPKIPKASPAPPRIQILDGSFVHLKVSPGQNTGSDLIVDGPQPLGGQLDPSSQCLTGQLHAVTASEDPFLSIQRKMIAVLADQYVGQKSGCRKAPFPKALRQRCDDRSRILVHLANIPGTHQSAAKEPARLIIELLADFLSDPTPLRGVCQHGLRFEHFFNHRQMFRNALFAWPTNRSAPWRGRRGCHRFRLRRLRLGLCEQQLQLVGRELLARAPEDSANQQVNLPTEQFVLSSRSFQSRHRRLQLAGQLGFTRRHHRRQNHSRCRARN